MKLSDDGQSYAVVAKIADKDGKMHDLNITFKKLMSSEEKESHANFTGTWMMSAQTGYPEYLKCNGKEGVFDMKKEKNIIRQTGDTIESTVLNGMNNYEGKTYKFTVGKEQEIENAFGEKMTMTPEWQDDGSLKQTHGKSRTYNMKLSDDGQSYAVVAKIADKDGKMHDLNITFKKLMSSEEKESHANFSGTWMMS